MMMVAVLYWHCLKHVNLVRKVLQLWKFAYCLVTEFASMRQCMLLVQFSCVRMMSIVSSLDQLLEDKFFGWACTKKKESVDHVGECYPVWLQDWATTTIMAWQNFGKILQRSRIFDPERYAPLMSSAVVPFIPQAGAFGSKTQGQRFLHHRLQSAWDVAKYVFHRPFASLRERDFYAEAVSFLSCLLRRGIENRGRIILPQKFVLKCA